MLFGTVSPSRLQDPTRVWFLSASHSFLFFCSVGFVDTVFSRFCFFFQALGKPKPFWFGFPLVFSSSCTRSTTTTRTSSSSTTPRGYAQPLFLFLFFVRRRSSFWWWLVLACCGRFGPLSLSLLAVRLRGEHECSDQTERGVAYQTAPPLFIAIIVFLG